MIKWRLKMAWAMVQADLVRWRHAWREVVRFRR